VQVQPDPVITPDVLEPGLRTEVIRRIDALDLNLIVDVRSHDEATLAQVRALLFEHWPELVGETLTAERSLLNRYYWFVRFITLWQQKYGYNAGMEQQAFRIIEALDRAGPEVDWNLVEELDKRARQI
jgi:hypothetical protein